MRVAFVTTTDAEAIEDDVDLPLELDAFSDAGVELELAPWEDESIDWTSFDLVVMRTPWNYVEHLDAFRSWLRGLDPSVRMHNPVEVIAWNLDKRYLRELAGRGVPIVPTAYIESAGQYRAALTTIGTREVVVKPSISAGSRMTGRFLRDDPAAEDLARRILDEGLTVMVQPFASPVDTDGELGTVLFDGVISHSFRKGPLLAEGGGLRGGVYREEITSARPSQDVLTVVGQAARAATDHARSEGWIGTHEELLYARIDIVTMDDGSPAVLEAELFEPCFFLPTDSSAVDRFVAAVLDRRES